MYSKVKIAGHPVHPMLIAYPIAGYTGTLAGFAVYTANGHQFWLNLAIALSVAASGAAVLAALPGLVDWLAGIPRRSPAKRIGLVHAALNTAALGLFAATAYLYFPNFNGPSADPTLGLALSAAGVALTLAAGFFGWMLVQHYHVGVQLTPAQEEDEPSLHSTDRSDGRTQQQDQRPPTTTYPAENTVPERTVGSAERQAWGGLLERDGGGTRPPPRR